MKQRHTISIVRSLVNAFGRRMSDSDIEDMAEEWHGQMKHKNFAIAQSAASALMRKRERFPKLAHLLGKIEELAKEEQEQNITTNRDRVERMLGWLRTEDGRDWLANTPGGAWFIGSRKFGKPFWERTEFGKRWKEENLERWAACRVAVQPFLSNKPNTGMLQAALENFPEHVQEQVAKEEKALAAAEPAEVDKQAALEQVGRFRGEYVRA